MMTRRAVLTSAILFSFLASAIGQPAAKADIRTASYLDSLIEHREYPRLEHLLASAKLDPTERDYYEGVLANRQNDLQKSIALLKKVLPALEQRNLKRAAVAVHSLADDYTKTLQYAEADNVYQVLLSKYWKRLPGDERQSIKDDSKTVHLLRDAPPQKVELNGRFSIPTHIGDLGTIESDLSVNGITKSWILDTGANYSVLSESAAQEMGLKLSEGAAQTQGSSGAENALHIAIIPEMKIGSAIAHNVVVLVLPDKGLLVPVAKGKHQIEAILGYPVLSALGQLTFRTGKLEVQAGGDESGAVMYMQKLDPLVQARVNGHDMLLFFDTGANSTALTVRYYNEFRPELANIERTNRRVGGAGGMKTVPSFVLPKVQIEVAGETAVLKKVAVNAEAMGTDSDLLYGVLGRDVTSEFKSFTLDFQSMRFRVAK